jgi:hypothetical protein
MHPAFAYSLFCCFVLLFGGILNIVAGWLAGWLAGFGTETVLPLHPARCN